LYAVAVTYGHELLIVLMKGERVIIKEGIEMTKKAHPQRSR
jgi:hypothetical protein